MSITGVIGSSLHTLRITILLILTDNLTIKFTLSVGSVLNHSQRQISNTSTICQELQGLFRSQLPLFVALDTPGKEQTKEYKKKNCPKVLKLIPLIIAQVEVYGVHGMQKSRRDVTNHVPFPCGASKFGKYFIRSLKGLTLNEADLSTHWTVLCSRPSMTSGPSRINPP